MSKSEAPLCRRSVCPALRQGDGKRAAAAGGALDRDAPAAQVEDAAHQRQAQAAAFGGAGGVGLIKLIKNMPQRLLGDANAFVADRDRDEGVFFVAFGAAADVDAPAVVAELDGVADQVVPHMAEHLGVGAAAQAGQVHLKGQTARGPAAFLAQHAGAQLFVQVAGGLVRHQVLRFVFGQQQDAAGQAGQAQRFGRDEVEVFVLLFRAQAAAEQPPRKAPDRDDGGLETRARRC